MTPSKATIQAASSNIKLWIICSDKLSQSIWETIFYPMGFLSCWNTKKWDGRPTIKRKSLWMFLMILLNFYVLVFNFCLLLFIFYVEEHFRYSDKLSQSIRETNFYPMGSLSCWNTRKWYGRPTITRRPLSVDFVQFQCFGFYLYFDLFFLCWGAF